VAGFAKFAGLYLPAFIAWQGFSFYADRFDTDDVLFRTVMIAAMLAIAALAVQIPDVAHGESTGFVIAYAVLRSLLVLLYVRSYRHVPQARPLIVRYASAYSLGVALWLASLAFDAPERYVIWGVALAWEYSQPIIWRRLHRDIPVSPSHVPERFGLFTIIVLGESIVAVALGTAASDWDLASAATGGLGFLVAASVWWIYFGFGTGTPTLPGPGAILAFAQAHIPLLLALTAVSAGIELAIEGALEGHLDAGSRWALCGGAILFLACVSITQRLTERGTPRGAVPMRATAAFGLAALASAAVDASAVAMTAAVAGILLAVAAIETLASAGRLGPARASS
jgi:low temperature requirement protein LtrA